MFTKMKALTLLLTLPAIFFLNSCNSSNSYTSKSKDHSPSKDYVMSSITNELEINSDNKSQQNSPEVKRIIENAPNPIGGVSIFDFHHYALNRQPFDNTLLEDGATNNMGLSLNSVHPLFSESISGNVEHYYENGEKPSGTTTSVWNFMMNADGMPSKYVPSTEEDKFCIYIHRRYSLAMIAVDAANAIVNIGFVNSPDQWWLQVYEIFDDEGKYSQKIAPDYLLRDHPASDASKFADLARIQQSIQTQANEKWCVGYSQPMVIKLTKGGRPINANEFDWPNVASPYLDPVVRIPKITGYPHFTGSAYLNITPDNASPNSIYLGMEHLAALIDIEGAKNTVNLNFDKKAYLHNAGFTALKLFWINFIKFDFSSGSTDPFTGIMNEVMDDKTIPLNDKMKILKKKLKTMQYSTLMKELKKYPVNKFKGSIYGGNFGTFKNVKKLANSFRKTGAINTLKGLKLKSLKNVLKGGGPEAILNLAFNVWGLATTIANPGNSTENILIYYIPDIMDGMTLFVDTSTKVNNFHLVSNIDGVVRTSYNTSNFPVDLFYEHVNLKLDNAAKNNKACFYNDPDDTSISYCFSSGEEYTTNAYVSSFTLPANHWLKVEMKNKQVLYITESFTQDQFLNSIAPLLLTISGIKLSLVDPSETLKSYSACFFLDDIFSGITLCENKGTYPLSDINFWAKTLNMESNIEALSTYKDRVAVQSIMINSEKNYLIETTLTDNRKFEVINDIPTNLFDIESAHYIKEVTIRDYGLDNDAYPFIPLSYCASLNLVGGKWKWVKTSFPFTEQNCESRNTTCNKGGICYKWFVDDSSRCQIFEREKDSWKDFLGLNNSNSCLAADNCDILNGDCMRWIDQKPYRCEYLISENDKWIWSDYPWVKDKAACESYSDKCATGGACFRWARPIEVIYPK